MPWFLVHTKPVKELLAATMLEERLKHATVYLPQTRQPFRGKVELRPFFPRYLFVALPEDALDELAKIHWTPGVHRLVRFGGVPAVVDDAIVQAIREGVEAIEAAGGLPPRRYKPGEWAKLLSGPLRDQPVKVLRHLSPADRVEVLLELLGRQNRLVVSVKDLEPLQEPPEPPRPRRNRRSTRGRGRRIRRNK